jgi:uncharacterized damage-inducible protein DinB
MWQARVDLFRDIEKALDEDPASEIAQALAARWRAQQDEASGGDSEIKEALLQGWANRGHWPASMRWQVEGLHMMAFERFEKAADFLDRAVASGTPETKQEEASEELAQNGMRRETVPDRTEGARRALCASMTNIRRGAVETLLAEFDEEMASTRRMLERVPEDKLAWKPRERSSTLAKLASHITAIPIPPLLLMNMTLGKKPSDVTSRAELLERFDKNLAEGREALSYANDALLDKVIPVMPGVSKPLMHVLRSRVMNHLIHHRGQLSVYLKLLDVALPGMYGPSADEKSWSGNGRDRAQLYVPLLEARFIHSTAFGYHREAVTKKPTVKQGQYLAFIFHYTKIHRCAPAEADMQDYFRVTPPSVHQMVLTLEANGFIDRVPGKARPIRVLIPPEDLPSLE